MIQRYNHLFRCWHPQRLSPAEIISDSACFFNVIGYSLFGHSGTSGSWASYTFFRGEKSIHRGYSLAIGLNLLLRWYKFLCLRVCVFGFVSSSLRDWLHQFNYVGEVFSWHLFGMDRFRFQWEKEIWEDYLYVGWYVAVLVDDITSNEESRWLFLKGAAEFMIMVCFSVHLAKASLK